jgi:hypothetical protein
MILLLAGTAAAQTPIVSPILTDGGNGAATIPRWPFFNYYTGFFEVNITNPQEGDTFYTSTHLLNASVTGNTTAITCYYRINGYGWNSYTFPSQQVTFPDGALTVYVYCSTSSASGGDSVSFEVYTKNAGGFKLTTFTLLFGTLFYIVVLEDSKPRWGENLIYKRNTQ